MSTKSSQHPHSNPPFQARHKVIVFTVVILGIAWLAWNMLYTRAAATAPLGAPAAVTAPVGATVPASAGH